MFLLLVKVQIIDPVEVLEIRSELEATILKERFGTPGLSPSSVSTGFLS